MNVMEEIDALAARGAVNGVTLWRRKDGWQGNFQSATTGGWTCLTRDTPSEALAAVLALNPANEEYDERHKLAKPAEPYDAEMLAPPAVDEPPIEELDAGIFD